MFQKTEGSNVFCSFLAVLISFIFILLSQNKKLETKNNAGRVGSIM